jgi:hypothetical protein
MAEESLSTIIVKIERGDIQIPEFQREFVWKPSQIELLADSIYKGFPIGMFIMFLPPPELGGREGIYWVLDGQQRLLSLSLITKGSVKLRDGQVKELCVWFNPETQEFACRKLGVNLGGKWIKIPQLFQIGTRAELEKWLSSLTLSPEEKERISTLWGNLRDYKILYFVVNPSADLDQLGEIFVRTNYGGTRVRGIDISSTIIAVVRSGTARELREFMKELPGEWKELDYSVAVKTFIAFLTGGKIKLASRVLDQASKLRELMGQKTMNQIRQTIDTTKESIRKAINLLEQGWLRIHTLKYGFLPYDSLVTVLAYYIGRKKTLSSAEENGLLVWYVLASYFGRYRASADTRLDEDLSTIASGGDYKELIRKLEEREGRNLKDSLKNEISEGVYNRLLLYALLRKNNARDLVSPNELDSRDVSEHHIFPYSLVGERANDVGNLTLTTLGTNNRLRDRKPEEYLRDVSPEVKKQHFIPDDPELWKVAKYEEFLQMRKRLLMNAIDELFSWI